MEENPKSLLIAPCGMNCSLCVSYQFMKDDLNRNGFHKKYCPGCVPRGEHCTYMKKKCDLLGRGLVRFCHECHRFPCETLKYLDKRYRTKYNMSMIENQLVIKEFGMEEFLRREDEKWRCSECGGVKCCHNGVCLKCNLEELRQKREK